MNHSYIKETRIMNTTVIEQSEQQAVLQKALHCAYLRAGNNPNIAALRLFAELQRYEGLGLFPRRK
jgi:hypothetical protein